MLIAAVILSMVGGVFCVTGYKEDLSKKANQ